MRLCDKYNVLSLNTLQPNLYSSSFCSTTYARCITMATMAMVAMNMADVLSYYI